MQEIGVKLNSIEQRTLDKKPNESKKHKEAPIRGINQQTLISQLLPPGEKSSPGSQKGQGPG